MIKCDAKDRKISKKGFTLIELLAVIVILGILMMVTIPAVTKYINNSKKDTFADSAGAYINSARYSLLNDEYDGCSLPSDAGQCVFVKIANIDIDKGGEKSSYGKNYNPNSYVQVKYDDSGSGKLTYEIDLLDNIGNGTNALILEKNLGRSTIKTKQSREITASKTGCVECTRKPTS